MSDDDPEAIDAVERAMGEIPGAELSDDEADEMFESAWGQTRSDQNETETGPEEDDGADVERLESHRGDADSSWNRAWVAAAALVAAVGAALLWTAPWRTEAPSGADESGGIKSPSDAPEVELVPLVGRIEEGEPEVGGRLEPGAQLEPGEHVLFRYELSRRSRLRLLGQSQGSKPEVLWSSERHQPAREAEIQERGRALSLDPTRYRGTFRLALVAGDREGVEAAAEVDSLAATNLEEACGGCGFDVVQLEAPENGD